MYHDGTKSVTHVEVPCKARFSKEIVVRAQPFVTVILFLIPGINIAAPFLWLAFNAWYLALEYTDYPMGNHGILFRKQHTQLKRMRLNAMGFSGGVLAMMAIPGINFLAMPAAVAGATVLWTRELAEEQAGSNESINLKTV